MNIEDFSDIFYLISNGSKDISSRRGSSFLRKKALKSYNQGIVKVAFDTRRVNQETDYIPRRGLQNYHRSESFLSEALTNKLKSFNKLKAVLDHLKSEYGKFPEWQDSYIRVLFNSIERAMRTKQKDGDYAETQPGVGSLDYLEELLYVRYRLTLENIDEMLEQEIEDKLLERDDSLNKLDIVHTRDYGDDRNYSQDYNYHHKSKPNLKTNAVESISKRDVVTNNYDALLDKLFGDVKPSEENKEFERTITITVKNKIME